MPQTQLQLFDDGSIESDAIFSPCRTWRYSLWRIWDRKLPMVQFIGLNPSTATETENDPTVTRCINYARDWGYGGMYMSNIFAFRATEPEDMKKAGNPVGPKNNHWLLKVHQEAAISVAAWGTDGAYLDREKQVLKLLGDLHCLKLTKHNHPWHPLYLNNTLAPIPVNIKTPTPCNIKVAA
jgi:hypothetical protein